MVETATAKSWFAVVLSVLAYLRGALNELTVVLVLLMMADYFIGVIGALVQGEFSVRRGIRGAAKKMCYPIPVIIGFLLDYALQYIGLHTGIQVETGGMFGYTVLCYLIGTEGLSCLRGLGRMGLQMPAFFQKGFGLLKDTADPEGAQEDTEEQ